MNMSLSFFIILVSICVLRPFQMVMKSISFVGYVYKFLRWMICLR